MKPVAILFAAPALFAHVMASPAAPAGSIKLDPSLYRSPVKEPGSIGTLTISGRDESTVLEVLEGRDLFSLDPRCSFHDGHGPVGCDTFSVVWGTSGSGVTLQGNNFKKSVTLNCANPSNYEGITSPLPYVVSISPGNTCYWKPKGEAFDGVVST